MAKAHQARFSFCGGHLALDFVNTVAWRLGDAPEERLRTAADLLAWCRRAKILTTDRATAIGRSLRDSEETSEAVMARSLAARETLYRLFVAALEGRAPDPADLAAFNGLVRSSQATVMWDGLRYVWRRFADAEAGDEILDPIVRSAAQLLTSELATKVAQCQDDRGCGWLFLDRSRSKARRWCSMEDCGNRAKVRRYYARARRA